MAAPSPSPLRHAASFESETFGIPFPDREIYRARGIYVAEKTPRFTPPPVQEGEEQRATLREIYFPFHFFFSPPPSL